MKKAFVALFVSSYAYAAGYVLPEQNARAVSMAGTGTAVSVGASTLYYNPGLTAFEDGLSAEVSGTLLAPMLSATSAGVTTASETAPAFAPSLFAAFPIGDALRLGLGAFSGYGARISWPRAFAGRFEGSASELTTYSIQPSISYRFGNIGVGAGVDIVRAAVELDRQLNFIDAEGALRLGGATWGFGANAGVAAMFLHDRLRLGLNYRSDVPLEIDGRADFSAPIEFQTALRDQAVRTHLSLPHIVSAGASYFVQRNLQLTADVTYTHWTTVKSLFLNFEDDSLDTTIPLGWHPTVSVRAGGMYAISERLRASAGLGYDPTPAPSDTVSPALPDASRVLVSAGAQYHLGNFDFGLGYMLAILLSQSSTLPAFPADYSGTAHLVSLTASFRQ